MLAPDVRVEVIFSKYDRVKAAGPQAEAYIEQAKTRLVTMFGVRIADLSFRNVAARPEGKELEFGHGVSAALRGWLSVPEPPIAGVPGHTDPGSQREFGCFGWRYRLTLKGPR
jgi:hypothetical protein